MSSSSDELHITKRSGGVTAEAATRWSRRSAADNLKVEKLTEKSPTFVAAIVSCPEGRWAKLGQSQSPSGRFLTSKVEEVETKRLVTPCDSTSTRLVGFATGRWKFLVGSGANIEHAMYDALLATHRRATDVGCVHYNFEDAFMLDESYPLPDAWTSWGVASMREWLTNCFPSDLVIREARTKMEKAGFDSLVLSAAANVVAVAITQVITSIVSVFVILVP